MSELILNRFEIKKQLGSGGSSQVFRAFDTRMERNVAIKRIEKKPYTVPRAIREAKTVALLSHPNIVTVHDFIEDDKFIYLVMEQIKGAVLSEILERTKLNFKQAIAAMLQVSHALECAHSNNIIHRDIKPANLILVPDGRIKVLDFGISRFKNTDEITHHDEIVGTLSYTSPEQAQAELVDERTDLFSLGVVAYEMLTGKNPFRAETNAATIFKILNSEPEHPSNINSEIPRAIGDIILKLLEKDPDDRFESAVMMRYKIQRHINKIDEQAELRKLAGVPAVPETGESNQIKTKLKIDKSTPIISRLYLGLVASFLIFTAGISAKMPSPMLAAGSLLALLTSLFIPRLGLLASLVLLAIASSYFYWWLGLMFLPILLAYFALTKYQKPLYSYLPFFAPVFTNLGFGFTYPLAIGFLAEKPSNVALPALLGSFIAILFDLFTSEKVRYFFLQSPQFVKNDSSILVIAAELGSIFINNIFLVLQPLLIMLVAFIFSSLKTRKNQKLPLWAQILNLALFGVLCLAVFLNGNFEEAIKSLVVYFAISVFAILAISFISPIFSKISEDNIEDGENEFA